MINSGVLSKQYEKLVRLPFYDIDEVLKLTQLTRLNAFFRNLDIAKVDLSPIFLQ